MPGTVIAGDSEWTLQSDHSFLGLNSPSYLAGVRWLLTVTLTAEQADQLLGSSPFQQGRRGCPSFELAKGGSRLTTQCTAQCIKITVTGIEVTVAEAAQIVSGADPLDILFGVPGCGYLLVAVPDLLLGWK